MRPALRRLTISVTPTLAWKWLIPRSPAFLETHPEIDLRILAARYRCGRLGAGGSHSCTRTSLRLTLRRARMAAAGSNEHEVALRFMQSTGCRHVTPRSESASRA
ncbi:hypothetical protein B7H01_05385 [Pandoraea apista]|nr:hypothetical protein B7H01_05385 [Pandoraea apista]